MKLLLATVALCLMTVSTVTADAPYPASGWKPDGPSFRLPEKQTSPKDSYFPSTEDAADPIKYGVPDDLSVQGLPPRGSVSQFNIPQNQGQFKQTPQQPQGQFLQISNKVQGKLVQGLPVQEPSPLFMLSPVNVKQYAGPSFRADLRDFEQQLRQQQAQRQLVNYDRQKQSESDPTEYNIQSQSSQYPKKALENSNDDNDSGKTSTTSTPRFGNPNLFQPRTTINTGFGQNTTPKQNIGPSDTNFNNASPNSTIESDKNKPSIRENIKEINKVDSQKSLNYEFTEQVQLPANYPYQLAQLALQQQLASAPFSQQIGQLQLPIIYQPAQAYTQRVAPPFLGQIQNFEPSNPTNLAAADFAIYQRQQYAVPKSEPEVTETNNQKPIDVTRKFKINQQENDPNPKIPSDDDKNSQNQQYFRGSVNDQSVFNSRAFSQGPYNGQEQYDQPAKPQTFSRQSTFRKTVQVPEPNQPGSIQSGFNVNQQGNSVESSRTDDDDNDDDDQSEDNDNASPASSGFGDRLPSQGFNRYGTPPQGEDRKLGRRPENNFPRTDGEDSRSEDDITQKKSMNEGRRRKYSKLRTHRIFPLFTIDKYGELVQLQ